VNPIVFVMRRPVKTLMLVVALASGGVMGLSKMRGDDFPPPNTSSPQLKTSSPQLDTPRIYASLDSIGMRAQKIVYASLDSVGTRAKQMKKYVVGQYESYFHKHNEEHKEEPRKVVVTSPRVMDVTVTQDYVCQIHSQRHIEVQALDTGYLKEIAVREGQAVKTDDVMFKIVPVLYKTRADAELAEARLAELEYINTKSLFDTKKVVSENEVKLFEAKKDRAKAKAAQAQAELAFTEIKAPFDGIVDRQHQQLGSFIKEGEKLTTLSDNRKMWVYFNVPEAQYLEYMANLKRHQQEDVIQLKLANQEIFPQPGKIDPSKGIGAIEANFNNQTGNIAFRADFDNPDGLLRHGQTGTIQIHRTLKNAVVIPQRATFEILDKRYVWLVGDDDVAHQSLITIKHELDDIFVIDTGLDMKGKIVLEGVREVEEGAKVEYEFRKPEDALALKNQKFRAE
jgi:membrane fusion protein, multidrug efflux system